MSPRLFTQQISPEHLLKPPDMGTTVRTANRTIQGQQCRSKQRVGGRAGKGLAVSKRTLIPGKETAKGGRGEEGKQRAGR